MVVLIILILILLLSKMASVEKRSFPLRARIPPLGKIGDFVEKAGDIQTNKTKKKRKLKDTIETLCLVPRGANNGPTNKQIRNKLLHRHPVIE